jgi:hypothetical protein
VGKYQIETCTCLKHKMGSLQRGLPIRVYERRWQVLANWRSRIVRAMWQGVHLNTHFASSVSLRCWLQLHISWWTLV